MRRSCIGGRRWWPTVSLVGSLLVVAAALNVDAREPVLLPSGKCSYKDPPLNEVVTGVPLVDDVDLYRRGRVRSRAKRSLQFENLRITPHYDVSISALSPEKQRYIKETLLPEAIVFWERALFIRRSNAPIRLNRKCVSPRYYATQNDVRIKCHAACRNVTRCGEVIIPDEHLYQCHYCRNPSAFTCGLAGPSDGAGVRGADFLLYVAAVASARCANPDTIAYAAYCQQEAELDRPIAGHVNLCPRAISVEEHDREVLASTVRHEILHALGFASSLYPYYRTMNGEPRTPRNSFGRPRSFNKETGTFEWSNATIKTVVRKNWWTNHGTMDHAVQMFVTPSVVREARRHFNCSHLEGAELENQGGEGTMLTHWEKRVFENEAMTGTHTQNPVYSRLTFALMEDTGWYKANYSITEPLHWGRNLGCDFAQRSCGEWIFNRQRKRQSTAPFCDRVKQHGGSSTSPPAAWTGATTTCTDMRDSLALCNLVRYKRPLPDDYQNFAILKSVDDRLLKYYGGSVELADFCPYNQEFEWRNDTQNDRRRDSRCEFEQNTPDVTANAALETYGEGAKCFNHHSKWTQKRCGYTRTYNHYGAGCYNYKCSAGLLWLELDNGTDVYPCYREGQRITIRRVLDNWLHSGTIVCPPCEDLCANTQNFTCAPDATAAEEYGDPQIGVPCRTDRIRSKLFWMLPHFLALTFVLCH